MNRFTTLMRREWLQYRFGWTMAALTPLAILLLFAAFADVQFGDLDKVGDALPAALAVGAIAGVMALMLLDLSLTSGIIVAGMARRDHGDRSIEFWLSQPIGHSSSLAAPLVVHLFLVPAAALVIGLAGGYVVSLVLVGRVAGVAQWLALPWGDIIPASLAMALRLLAGVALATVWLSPLILLLILLLAWFRAWGLVILALGIVLGSALLKRVFGEPLLADTLLALLAHAATSIIHGGSGTLRIEGTNEGLAALRFVPAWALSDLGASVRELAQPLLAGAVAFAAGCFALLVEWRQRGASAAV
jgi:ABC-2 type transport system permease protein